MKRLLATLLWAPMAVVVLALTLLGGVLISIAAALIPAVAALSKIGDE